MKKGRVKNEDAVCKAVSLCGDSDTIPSLASPAGFAGSLAR